MPRMDANTSSCGADRNSRLERFLAALTMWWRESGKDYPWRRVNSDPYRTYVAEVMLHRTKAEKVAELYERFLRRFPSINSLASASLDEVEELLAPLGLRWRWALMLRTAKIVMDRYQGKFPEDRDSLLELPGVGQYISGAILVFGYGRREVFHDVNISRVLRRYFSLRTIDEVEAVLAELVSKTENVKELYLSLIDLAKDICTARRPRCSQCPLSECCIAAQSVASYDDGERFSIHHKHRRKG